MRFLAAFLFVTVAWGGWATSGAGGPQAIVSLTLMTDEFLADLVPPERIRAFSRYADDPVLSNVPASVRAAVPLRVRLDLEQLLSLHPDLVLAADWNDAEALRFLEAHGCPVYVVKTPRSWTDVKNRIGEIGSRLGARAEAQDLLDRLLVRQKRLEVLPRRGQTVLEYNTFGRSMGAGTLWNDMVTLAGLVNPSQGLPSDAYGYAPLSKEVLLRLDPDWLVLPSAAAAEAYGSGSFLRELEADPLFRNLRAVKAARVLILPESLKTTTSHAALRAAEVLFDATSANLR